MNEFLIASGVSDWVLPALFLWPLLAALMVRLFGREEGQGLDARVLTLAALVVEGLLGLALWGVFDSDARGWQARVDAPWLSDIGATFSLGVDGLAMPMVVLTSLVMPLALIASWDNVRVKTPAFGSLALVLVAGMIGIFVSLDLLLFYLSWELMLIPMYFLIGIWGTGASARASTRYVLFTLVGSLLMLVAIVALWNLGGGTSFHFDHLALVKLGFRAQLFMFLAFFIAFAVKSALVPFHTWLPDAQSSAPTFVAVALGFKVGTYAILRFAIPMFPAAATNDTVRGTILVLSVIGIIYGALLAMAQRDMKRMIAYSSISHLGFIMLGAFALTQQSVQGAVMVMVNHGISTSALFLLAGMLEDRRGTNEMGAYGGLARVVPVFSIMLTLAMLSTIGLPGTNGFIGEFLVLIGTYPDQPVFAVIATSGVIFAAVYGLRMLQRLLFDKLDDGTNASMRDLSRRELAVMGVFAVGILWIGVAPRPLLQRIERASVDVVQAARFGPNAAAQPALSVTR
ncbi:MAG: NADH-quinone oxidoreductase subunit M [Gemmatimonadota bacterium]